MCPQAICRTREILESRIQESETRIFVSHRHEDAAGQAGRLHDALAARSDEESIFQDVSTIRPGEGSVDIAVL